jgi:hypothetical protein
MNVACMRKKTNAYTFFVGKSEGKRPLGISGRRRLEDNIKMDIGDSI